MIQRMRRGSNILDINWLITSVHFQKITMAQIQGF